jgi:hypothetical protein
MTPVALLTVLTIANTGLAQDSSADELDLLSNGKAAPEEAAETEPPTALTGNSVAVVIGLSAYTNLPDAVELDFARSDAATVHKALTEEARYSHTFLITDGEATRERIRTLIREEVAQITGPDDLFLFYFVGHGLGADLDLPTLLTHDSTMENGQEDGLELVSFARDLQTWTRAGTTIIVTDVIHRNQLDGIYFFGPAANQWPAMPKNTVIFSASQAESPGTDGAFGTVFADGISGAADVNRDSFVTANELLGYLQHRMSPVGQIPVASGEYPNNLVVSSGVQARVATESSETDAPIPDPEPVYPDTEIWSAKFVFHEGESQAVHCRGMDVKACSPSCYVRKFKAGPCDLSAVLDGTRMEGRVIVLWPGKYTCGRRAGDLICTPPRTAAPAEAKFAPSLSD